MHIMKKQILILVTLFAALTLWAGCGSKEASTEDSMAAEAEKAAAASESDMEKAKAEAEKMAKEAEAEAKKAADALNK